MLKKSKSALHAFLFYLRTPLASIRSVATFVDKNEIEDRQFPLEACEWLRKWIPKVDIWFQKAVELTEFCGRSEDEEYDWKALIQQLLFSLEGVEVAALEFNDILSSDKDVSGDLVHMIRNSIEHINDDYKTMQELLPKLD